MATDTTDPAGPSDKASWRRHQLRRRRARPADERAAAAAAVAATLPAVLSDVDPDAPVCLHVPVGTEPGVAPDGALPLLDAAVALGRQVLLPVTVGDAPLDWARYRDRTDLGPGPHGLLEPTGGRLGPDAVATAGIVLVPALAVDARGIRLGRGGGHYDRTLPLVRGSKPGIVALVFDDEVVGALPVEDHDVRVDVVWRALRGPSAADRSPAGSEHGGLRRG